MEFWLNAINQGLILAIFAISLNVILGYAGQLAIAPAGFGAVGGFTAAYVATVYDWRFGLAVVLGIFAAFCVGLALGIPALRLGPDYLILLTLSFATITTSLVLSIPALGGTYGIIGIPVIDIAGPLFEPSELLIVVGPGLVVAAFICWLLVASPIGRILKGIREDVDVVESLGKNVSHHKVVTFAITAGIAGFGGVLLVYYQQIAVTAQFDFNATIAIVAGVIVGGLGNLAGAFVGTMMLALVAPVLQRTIHLAPEKAALWQVLLYGLLLIVVMRLRPAGLIPEGTRLLPRFHGGAGSEGSSSGDDVDVTQSPRRGASTLSFREGRADTGEQPGVSTSLPAGSAATPILRASGLVKHFGGIRAVDGLDLELQEATVSAIVGPNGAGKTTVFNLLTGRIKPDSGSVRLRERMITGLSTHDIARAGVVRSFQDVRTIGRMTLIDNVRLGVRDQVGERYAAVYLRPFAVRRGERRTTEFARECLAFVGLERRALDLAGSLGFGDQKLLAIARVLATEAEVFLVDEPAAGVDRSSLEPVIKAIEDLRDAGKTVCIVEHNLEVVGRLAEHVIFMEEGRVSAEGTMDEIRSIERLEAVYFGHA